MSLSLYDALVPSMLQVVRALPGVLDKADAFATDRGLTADDLVAAKLADDMLPLGYQVRSLATHSIRAIEALPAGLFTPDMTPAPTTMAASRALLADTVAKLEALDPAEVDALQGREVRFEARGLALPFVAENFLLSFSQLNFYFHATTAYAILRAQGVPLGKRDFLGMPRIKV